MNHLNFVIAGHVDHGKSTLIGRLLYDTNSLPEGVMEEVKRVCEEQGKEVEFAYLLDSLEEERQQNVTIDTTQIMFKTPKRQYTIIDAPGHREFLKNMITGSSMADAAVLIIDAKEGIQEQTKRHAYMLHLLGIQQLIVLINKMDFVEYAEAKYTELKTGIKEFLSQLNLVPEHVIPISAKMGDNIATKSDKMQWYSGPAFLEALDSFNKKENKSKNLRFPVQDVYKFDERRILAGRIESGTLKAGDDVVFLPSNKKTKVKSIEIWNSEKTSAEAGDSIGVTLEDPLFIERGEVLCDSDLPQQTSQVKATVFWMSKTPLKIGEQLQLQCTTQDISCTLEQIDSKIDSSTLKPLDKNNLLAETEVGTVVLKTAKPAVIEDFSKVEALGRFVLVRGHDVVGGGVIVS